VTKLEQIKQKILHQALTLSTEKGWDGFAMTELQDYFPNDALLLRSLVKDKKDVFRLLCDSMKNFVNDNSEPSKETYDNMPLKDILFDKIMLHFDFLQLHKKHFDSLEKFVLTHPDYTWIFLSSLPDLDFPLKKIKSGISTPYHNIPVNRIALSGVFVYSLRAWKTDSSPDMSKTMAAVDKALNFILKE